MAKLLLGSVVGPQGPQGTPGVNGSQGPQGVPGPNEIAATTEVVGLTTGQLLYNNGGKVGSVEIVDNLLSVNPNKPLSANQGKVLKGLIDGNSSAIGQKADKTQLSNPNLLINGDFQVWQRGDGSKTVIGTGSNQYTADRWIFASINPVKCNYVGSDYDGLIRFHSDGIIAPSNTRFEQFLPLSPNMRRQLYTFSVKARCTGVSSKRIGMSLRNKDTGEIYVKGEFVVTRDNWKLIHLPPVWVEKCDILAVSFGICTNTSDYHGLTSPQGMNVGESIDILYAKLEYGELPTMFVSKSYAEELAMCQRYYLPPILRGVVLQIDGNSIYFGVPIYLNMRTTPSMAGVSFDVQGIDGIVKTGFTVSLFSISQNFYIFLASKTGHGLTNASLVLKSGGLDAEIY